MSSRIFLIFLKPSNLVTVVGSWEAQRKHDFRMETCHYCEKQFTWVHKAIFLRDIWWWSGYLAQKIRKQEASVCEGHVCMICTRYSLYSSMISLFPPTIVVAKWDMINEFYALQWNWCLLLISSTSQHIKHVLSKEQTIQWCIFPLYGILVILVLRVVLEFHENECLFSKQF